MPRIGKFIEIENRLMVAREPEGRREWGMTANGFGLYLGGHEMI